MKKGSLFALNLSDLQTLLLEQGFPKYCAKQVFHWLYRHHNYQLSDWNNTKKSLRKFIEENLDLNLPKIIKTHHSQDGTRKYLVGFEDGYSVESVLIKAENRLTLCVSSQVGCAIGCRFCHTGLMGLKRHLSSAEIVTQFMLLSKQIFPEKITNIVFMGQGEPLHNFESVKKAVEIFLEPNGLALSQRKITLSTSGLVPQIEKLQEFPPVNIAISLHAATDEIRSELMPINKRYDLKRLFKAIKKIPLKAQRRITYEYLLIDGLNDRKEDISGLTNLLDTKESKINLIPFNEYPKSNFKRPCAEKISWFREELTKRKFVCTVRKTAGDDILAACGQLNCD